MTAKIILYGVPGSGKTSLARALSDLLKIPNIEADEIRKIGKEGRTPESDPYYFLPTTEAYQAIGERTPENVIQGLKNVRAAYKDLIYQELKSHASGFVMESAFLDPAALKENGTVILLTTPSEAEHRKHFLNHRTEDAFTNGQFENARTIQEFLLTEVEQLQIPVIRNEGTLDALVEQARKILSV